MHPIRGSCPLIAIRDRLAWYPRLMSWSDPSALRCAIFVGGASRRMGGYPKALLRLPDGETLIARTVRVVREAGLSPALVGLVGAPQSSLPGDVPVLADAAIDAGPLGGLVAALESTAGLVVVVACDLPRLDAASLRLLRDARSAAPIVAARRADRWEPLFARYEAARVLPLARKRLARGALALQGLLDAAGASILELGVSAALDDVDTTLEAARAGLSRDPRHEVEAR